MKPFSSYRTRALAQAGLALTLSVGLTAAALPAHAASAGAAAQHATAATSKTTKATATAKPLKTAKAAPGSTSAKATPDPLWKAMAVAAAAAKKSHHATMVDSATNAYATLVANPDGTFTARQYVEPQRAKVDGKWVPIDTTLVKAANGTVHAKADVAAVTLSGGGSGALATVDDGSGHVLSFSWPGGALPAPVLNGDTATYPNVYPGVDLQMVVQPAGVQNLFVVHDAKAAANPALKDLGLKVSGKGLTISATADGGVAAKDAHGHVVFGGPTPRMWDATAGAAESMPATAASAASKSHSAALRASVSGGLVRVSPDEAMLTDPEARFPMVIDPVWTENPQNWIELWSNGNTVYDGSPAPYSGYDNRAVRVGNSAGTLVRSLFSFSAMPLPRAGNYDAVGPFQQAIYITSATVNLTAQSSYCPSTQVWRANPFGPAANWSNQNSPQLWPPSGSDFNNPMTTLGGFSNCAGHVWNILDTSQVQDVYNAGGGSYTIGLRAANEGPTTNNYGSFWVYNNPAAVNMAVNFAAEPFGLATRIGTAPVGNQGGRTTVCSSDENNPGYLPLTTGSIPVQADIADWDARPVYYQFFINGATNAGTLPAGSGTITTPAWAGESSVPGQTGNSYATVTGQVQANGQYGLVDGGNYELFAQMWDNGSDALGSELNTAMDNAGNTTGTSLPHTPVCYFKAAMTPPNQPTVSSTTYPAEGQHLGGGYPTVGTAGTITVNGTAPTTPIVRFDWALNTASTNEGAGHCGSVNGIACGSVGGVNSTNATAQIQIPTNATRWGTNYLYVSAVDAAGNVSSYARYDFFMAQAFQPESFGNVTGTGEPDVLAVDANGNLVTYETNLDPTPGAESGSSANPTPASNAVQAAPASAAPNGTSWVGALYTHRGSERVQPTDDMFAWAKTSDNNGHLYYYYNSVRLTSSTAAGQNPDIPVDAFTQGSKSPVTRPACVPAAANGWCVGYDPTWNSVLQIAAIGPVNGGCDLTQPSPACKTNLVTIEADPKGGLPRLWMFSPAGIGQLTNPVLLSTSQDGWNWGTMRLLNPGNAAGHPGGAGGLPDLWVQDASGSLWQFANSGGGAGLGSVGARTLLGRTGEYAHFTTTWAGTDASGNPDLWGLWPDGQVTVLTGALSIDPSASGQTTATPIGWGGIVGGNVEGRMLPTGLSGAFVSGLSTAGQQVCLDDLSGSLANSTTVIDSFGCNATWPQRWALGADDTVREMGSNPASPTNKCLDTGGSLLLSANVTLYDCQAGNPFQVWKAFPSTNAPGAAELYNPASGLCLNASGSANHSPFQLGQCQDQGAQQFSLPTGVGQAQSAEAESVWGSAAGGGTMSEQTNCCGVSWSNGAQEWLVSQAANASMTLNYYLPNAGTYDFAPVMTKAANYGIVTASIDGVNLPNLFDGYNNGVLVQRFDFGAATLSAGYHAITFTVAGTDAASTGYRYEAGADTLDFVPTSGLAPVAALTLPANAQTGIPVTADASASVGGASSIANYTFDFGDGTVLPAQSGATAAHTYSAAGNYTVTVTATDSAGRTGTAAQEVTVVAQPVPTSEWKLSDGTGATAADSGTPGGNPAAATAVSLAPGGYALFNGNTGENLATTGQVLDTAKSFTVSAWANQEFTSNSHTVVAQNGQTGAGFWLGYDHTLDAWALTTIQGDAAQTASYSAAGAAGTATPGVWTHLIGVYDASTGKLSLYINGVLQSRQDAWPTPFTATGKLTIGEGLVNGALTNVFHGGIADVRVYQQALSATQAAWLYQNTGFVQPTGPVYGVSAPTALTSSDGTAVGCSTDPAHPAVSTSATPYLGASVPGTANHADFEMRDVTDPQTAPPLVFGGTGSVSTTGSTVSLQTQALTNGHEYAFAARTNGQGLVSAATASCYLQVSVGGQATATPTGAVGIFFDNTLYPASAGPITWSGPLTNLVWQSNGHLVVTDKSGKVLWDDGATTGAYLAVQTDGDLVIYSSPPLNTGAGTMSGHSVWTSATPGKGATGLVVQPDGNVVINGPSGVLWSTGTT